MTLLTPLGLLGLISIIVLIIIYIIRPNYQQKIVSSTYVWLLSLKYRKKRIPVSKLRNILIIVCQVLALTACALILAQPNQVVKTQTTEREVVLIIDSSASMRTQTDGKTRYESAVYGAIDLANQVFDGKGYVSVIIADHAPENFLAYRLGASKRADVISPLDQMVDEKKNPFTSCGYAQSDIEGALELSKDVLAENPAAEIHIFSDVAYVVPEGVELHPVAVEGEWNAAILNAEAVKEENYYQFVVEVAAYNKDEDVEVVVQAFGVNADNSTAQGTTRTFYTTVTCRNDEVKTVLFINQSIYDEDPERYDMSYDKVETINDEEKVYNYQSIHVYINENDSFADDNGFDIYSGQKQLIKIQYASSMPNNFFAGALATLKTFYADRWDMQVTEVKKGTEPQLTGFDFYIFEHDMPESLPTDGVVLAVNPADTSPLNSGFDASGIESLGDSIGMTEETKHPLLNGITAGNITASSIVNMSFEGDYKTLLGCATYPALTVKESATEKIVVMAFSLHYSNLPLLIDFPIFMYNMFEYFFPATVKANTFEVNETVEFNAIGNTLSITGYNFTQTLNTFPTMLTLTSPGTYELKQKTLGGRELTERIYVKIPKSESDIWQEAIAISDPYAAHDFSDFYNDLLVWIAAALVALLLVEWLLSSRETM